MKVLVCGSRQLTYEKHYHLIWARISTLPRPCTVVHGDARGADHLAGLAAVRMGMSVTAFPAHWDKEGKAAGPIRNARMLSAGGLPDLVLAFHTNPTLGKGTAHMVKIAKAAGVKVEVVLLAL